MKRSPNNRLESDAPAKLLIERGLITEAEFMEKLSAERVGYQAMAKKVGGQVTGLKLVKRN